MNLHDLSARFKNWQAYRRTYNELSNLSQRELDDLGIGRSDIARIARTGRR